jgi:hypothetical protein
MTTGTGERTPGSDQEDSVARSQPAENPQKKKLADNLFGNVYANKSLTDDQKLAQAAKIQGLLDIAFPANVAGVPNAETGNVAANDGAATLAQLEAMDRASQIPSWDAAAKALTGIVTVVTGAYAAIGFTTGDLTQMIHNSPRLGFWLLGLVGLVILVGTFAIVTNSYASDRNLTYEQIAVCSGILVAAVAFGLAAWGLSEAAQPLSTRPTISESATAGTKPTLTISATSSGLQARSVLAESVWGEATPGHWVPVSTVTAGPDKTGAASTSLLVSNAGAYAEIEAVAALSPGELPATGGSCPSPSALPADEACVLLAAAAI